MASLHTQNPFHPIRAHFMFTDSKAQIRSLYGSGDFWNQIMAATAAIGEKFILDLEYKHADTYNPSWKGPAHTAIMWGNGPANEKDSYLTLHPISSSTLTQTKVSKISQHVIQEKGEEVNPHSEESPPELTQEEKLEQKCKIVFRDLSTFLEMPREITDEYLSRVGKHILGWTLAAEQAPQNTDNPNLTSLINAFQRLVLMINELEKPLAQARTEPLNVEEYSRTLKGKCRFLIITSILNKVLKQQGGFKKDDLLQLIKLLQTHTYSFVRKAAVFLTPFLKLVWKQVETLVFEENSGIDLDMLFTIMNIILRFGSPSDFDYMDLINKIGHCMTKIDEDKGQGEVKYSANIKKNIYCHYLAKIFHLSLPVKLRLMIKDGIDDINLILAKLSEFQSKFNRPGFDSLQITLDRHLIEELLEAAVYIGNIKALENFLYFNQGGIRIHYSELDDALHAATKIGQVEALEILLNFNQNGTRISQHGLDGAFHTALLYSQVEALELILSFNKNGIRISQERFDRVLAEELWYDQRVLELILSFNKNGIRPSQKGFNTVLRLAARRGWIGVLQLLLNFNQNEIQLSQEAFNEALNTAAWSGQIEALQLLLNFNQNEIQLSQEAFNEALATAACSGQIEALQLLLNFNQNEIQLSQEAFNAALKLAARSGWIGVLQLLLNFNQNGTIISQQGLDAALKAAAGGGYIEVLQLLLNFNQNGTIISQQGLDAALKQAVWSNRTKVLQLLLNFYQNGISLSQQELDAALKEAARLDYREIHEILLKFSQNGTYPSQ